MKKENNNKNYYLKMYFGFLRQEIPNIIQIITFLGFLIIISKNNLFQFIITLIVGNLLALYLIEKMSTYIKKQA